MIKLKWKYKIDKVRIVKFWNRNEKSYNGKIVIEEFNITVVKYER